MWEGESHFLQALILLYRTHESVDRVAVDLTCQKDDSHRVFAVPGRVICQHVLYLSLSERRRRFAARRMDKACRLSIPDKPNLSKTHGHRLKAVADRLITVLVEIPQNGQ